MDGKTGGQTPVSESPGPVVEAATDARGSQWERPAAAAKDRNVRAWLIFLGLLCLGVALWTPIRALYYRRTYQEVTSVAQRDAEAFVAIAYHGVSQDAMPGSQDISTAAFASHLKLLRENGYTPIGLDDVRAFYREGKLLPRKAVLMTFEQSRRSSYFEVRDLLRDYKWRAVMGVNTLPMRTKDPQMLLWPYLRDMCTMGAWDLAAQSHQGFVPVDVNPVGRKGYFFSNPLWLASQNRYELPEEFNARIEEDHLSVIGEFQREVGFKPIAFFFPYGDYGQYDERAHVVRVTNMHQVGHLYDLGFILGQLALNSRNSDPRRLNRLLVNPQWLPETFIAKLNSFWPSHSISGAQSAGYSPDAWIGEWGDVFARNDELVLRAVPPMNPLEDEGQTKVTGTTGAKAWMTGSDMFKDGFLSIRFTHKRGRFVVYLRSTSQGEYISFCIDELGRLSVRQKASDVDELILASDSYMGEGAKSHELLLCLRDNLLFARLDGSTLFGGRVLLHGDSKSGVVGLGVWDEIPGIAEAVVFDVRLVGRRDALVCWAADVTRDPAYLTTWLNEHGYRFTVLSPPWLDIFENAPITFPIWDQQAISLLARTNGARVLPHVQVRDATLLLKVSADEVVARAAEYDVQGLYVDASLCASEQVTPLVTWLIKLNDALREKHLQLALRLPLSIETLPSSGSIMKLLPGVALAGDYQRPPFNLRADEVLGVTQVAPPANDETLALYYQISRMMSVYNDISPDAKKDELRQKGFNAFTAGEYDKAIQLWEEWSKLEPRNAEPYALMGDAWQRLNELSKALDAYTQSLEMNPGQMGLAIRHSRLLEQMNRLDESSEMLNAYARAFPDSPPVVIAQAQWLDRHRQRNEARELMRKLVATYPENIEARLVLQNLLDEPAARYANMQDLLSIGKAAETQLFGFGRDIFAAELLTIPEASLFFDFVRETAQKNPNKKTRALYQGFLPLTSNVVENFTANKLSDNWVAFGGLLPTSFGRYELRAGADMSEAFLRLKNSEMIRDGFIEVTLDESVGSFWLYARRSTRSMVRYGYDDEGYIRIQSWFNGDIRSFDGRPWLRPPGKVRLRLEVRGDGAIGYVNGKQVFTTPISIPLDVSYGWWSVAPYSSELGMARARIARIECGTLAPTILFLPPLTVNEARGALEYLRPRVRDMTALAPVVFSQLPDGSIPTTPDTDLSVYRMFCMFHRLRLMPVVNLSYYSDVPPNYLVELILKHRLSGLILRTLTMPDAVWQKKMEEMLETTTADLIVIQHEDSCWPVVESEGEMDAAQELTRLRQFPKVDVREIQRGSLLLHPIQDQWKVPYMPLADWLANRSPEVREGSEPRLVIVPRRFAALPEARPYEEGAPVLAPTSVSAQEETAAAEQAAGKVPAAAGGVRSDAQRLETVAQEAARANAVLQPGAAAVVTNAVLQSVAVVTASNTSARLKAVATNAVLQSGAAAAVTNVSASQNAAVTNVAGRSLWERLKTTAPPEVQRPPEKKAPRLPE